MKAEVMASLWLYITTREMDYHYFKNSRPAHTIVAKVKTSNSSMKDPKIQKPKV